MEMMIVAFLEHTFEVGLRDTGRSNHLSNKAFLAYMEDIGGIHSEIAGYGMNEIQNTHLSWILLSWKVKIFKRPFYGETIKVKTWARGIEKFYTYRDFEIYNQSNELVAIATSKWVLLHTLTGKLMHITEEILSKYTPETKTVFPDNHFGKLKEPSTYLNSNSFTILRSQIDINNHMHNLYYLDLAYEVLPEDIYQNAELNHIEIMYKKEITLHDTVTCHYSYENEKHVITIKSKDDTILHAIIQLS